MGAGAAAAAAAAAGNSQEKKVAKIINHHFLWVSEVTLGSFLAHFDALPSFTAMGICRWEWFAAGNSQEKKVAKIIIFYGFQKLH